MIVGTIVGQAVNKRSYIIMKAERVLEDKSGGMKGFE